MIRIYVKRLVHIVTDVQQLVAEDGERHLGEQVALGFDWPDDRDDDGGGWWLPRIVE